MALIQLLYVSSLVVDCKVTMRQIVSVAAANNERRNITGMLLYADGNILQVIEGETEALYTTFASIEADPRHRGLIVLSEKEVAARDFADWRLGFKHLSRADIVQFPVIAPVFEIGERPFPIRVQPSHAIATMQSFAKISSNYQTY